MERQNRFLLVFSNTWEVYDQETYKVVAYGKQKSELQEVCKRLNQEFEYELTLLELGQEYIAYG